MNQNGSTALALATPQHGPMTHRAPDVSPLEPASFEQGIQLAQIVAKTGMFGVKSWEDAFVRMSKGMSLGLSAAQSLSALYVIGGKPAMYADAMQALALSSPHVEYFTLIESDDRHAVFEAKRRGDPNPIRRAFTLEDAERAKLTSNENYKKYPQSMLEARAKAMLARLVCPEKLHGIYTPEELNGAGVGDEQRQARPARSAPAAAAATSVDPETVATLAAEFAKQIDDAPNEGALKKVAAAIKAANLPPVVSDPLKKRYADRLTALGVPPRKRTPAAQPAPEQAAPHADDKPAVPEGEFEPVGREPGSDG